MDTKNFPPVLSTESPVAYRGHGNITPHIIGLGLNECEILALRFGPFTPGQDLLVTSL